MENNSTYKIENLLKQGEPWLLLVGRVSDESQLAALPAQKKRLLEYGESKEHPYVYLEFNETAFKGERIRFKEQVLEPLQKASGLVIVTFDKIDRFSRDASSDEKNIMNKLLKNGAIELHFPADNLFIHRESPASDLFRLDIGVALAGYYSAAIRDNVKRRFEQKIAEGEWPGKAPIGYKNIITGYTSKNEPIKDIAPDPERKELVKQGLQMRSVGMSYGAIANTLQKAGLTSTVRGKPIPKTQVEHFLKNPFYMGVMRYEGKLYSHKYEPLIEPWMWKKIQEVDARRSKIRTKQVGKEYIYKGLIKCADCGYSVFCDGPKKGNNFYLMCTEYGGKHDAKRLNETVINAQVVAILESVRVPEHMIPGLVDDLRAEFDNEQRFYQQNVKRLQHDYDKFDEEIKNMFRDRSKFKIKPELFDELISEKTQMQGDLLEQIKDHSRGNEQFILSASKILEVAHNASELFLSQDVRMSQKHRLLEFVLSNLRLSGETLLFELKTPFDVIAGCSKNDSWGE